MLDVMMVAIALGFFVLALGYVIACDRMWGARHGLRLRPRLDHDPRDHGLSGLRADPARALL